jgi:hypothetical protein
MLPTLTVTILEKKMVSYSDDQIKDLIEEFYRKTDQCFGTSVELERSYAELFQQIAKQGFKSSLINGRVPTSQPE